MHFISFYYMICNCLYMVFSWFSHSIGMVLMYLRLRFEVVAY